jgi:uncharacterized protein
VETHTATLRFSGDRVYKVKKAVRFPFLDFTSREARESACRREVELNARLSPDVYLGVDSGSVIGGSPGEPTVVMRRLPDDRRLSRLLDRPGATERVAEIARAVAAFHARAVRSDEIDAAGSADAIAQNWRDNFDQMPPFAGVYFAERTLRRAEELSRRFIAGRRRLFDRRITAGEIRDGHGDLLADDIFCLPDGPRILDCIEFNDRLRYGDVVGDIAFLAMDIERLGHPELASELLDRYREYSGHGAPEGLLHLYVAYRAQVRAKVACIRAEQGDPDAPAEARRLLDLAVRHLEAARVRLVLVGGPPGTGKTTLTHLLSDDRGWPHLHSDETRKELAGLPYQARADAPYGEGIYRAEMTTATYVTMISRAKSLLSVGESVVLDASWSDTALRDAAAATAFEAFADIVEFRCAASSETAAMRIDRRRAAGMDASDATPSIAATMARRSDPWPTAIRIDTSATPLATLRSVRQALGRTPLEEPFAGFFVPATTAPTDHRTAS